jgi:hypothetical protein
MLRPVLMGLALALPASLLAADRPRAPFRVVYSNDCTNILTCVSPFHRPKQELTEDMLRATIDEAGGVDVHMLQPGLGAIPFWQSKVYPPKEHFEYYEKKYKFRPSGFARYLMDGGDLVKVFVEHCRRKNVAPFVSLRMNDGHGLETVGTADRYAANAVTRFYEDHYREYRLGPDANDWNQRVLNWAIPEVRQFKLALLRELCENYDLAGLELDFMRHSCYFQLHKTTSAQRREIMTGFVREVRQLLDRTGRPGRRRWLCVRVPVIVDAYDSMGFDLPAMAREGVDMFNLSFSYFTVQQTDLPKIRRLVPESAIYLEMTHTTLTGAKRGAGYDSYLFERTAPQQFYTTAHLAYAQGADGVSLFNFVYYREHGGPGRGPFNEPPFEVLGHLGDREWLARQPEWYHLAGLGTKWYQMGKTGEKPLTPPPLPKLLSAGNHARFTVELAPTQHQQRDGVLRLMTRESIGKAVWEVAVNDTPLQPTELVLKPLEHSYDAHVCEPDQWACFRCPRSCVKPGSNVISVTLKSGDKSIVQYFDLVLP